jgi:hypothetical protein
MAEELPTILSACGRVVGPEEIRHLREVARMCQGLSRHELELTLCEHWGWYGAGGKAQVRACRKVLERLQRDGFVELPAKQKQSPRQSPRPHAQSCREVPAPEAELRCVLADVRPVVLEGVGEPKEVAQWNATVGRYHPLGYKAPFGRSLRYFIRSRRGLLGCLLVASGARALRCRDEWIGWSAPQRLRNLAYVINNSRFLLLPWVRVSDLASHVLGRLARQVREDWFARWGYRPVLMETFVDPAHHRGVCYLAAGWTGVGETSGSGLRLARHSYTSSRKLVFVQPLVRDCRALLQSGPPPGRERQ